MRIFKTKWFARTMRNEGMQDERLVEAVREINKGLVDASYGGGMIKKRIPRDGGGKSGGYRSIVAFKAAERCIFFFLFAKNDKDNLDAKERTEYKAAAAIYLSMKDAAIEKAKDAGELVEVEYDEEEI